MAGQFIPETMTDTDLMPFGKHKGTKMANVPADYLLWLYNEPYAVYNNYHLKHVKKYVEENLDALKLETKK